VDHCGHISGGGGLALIGGLGQYVSWEVLESCGSLLFYACTGCRYHGPGTGTVLSSLLSLPLGLLRSRQKLTGKPHFTNTAAMNRGLQFDNDDAHQMLKDTKSKMCEILAQIAANQEDHREPLDVKVSIIWDLIHLLELIVHSHPQGLPITASLL